MPRTLIGNFKGPKGNTGEQGPQGVPGPQGLPGEKGDPGAVDENTPIIFEVPETYEIPVSGNAIKVLFGKITKGLSDLFAAVGVLASLKTVEKSTLVAAINELAEKKFDVEKIVASANITEPGFVMDGKTASEAIAELYSKNGAFSQFPKYPIDSYPNIWDAPSGFYVLYSADTGYLLEVPNEIPGSRVYILKSKITDTNFCMIFSSSRKALYMGYEYGTTHVWQKIVGMVL